MSASPRAKEFEAMQKRREAMDGGEVRYVVNEVRILKGIPVSQRPRNIDGRWRQVAEAMEVGDCVEVKNVSSICKHIRQLGFTPRSTKLAPGRVRVWKLPADFGKGGKRA